jgi:hypothetical protein
MAGKRLVGMRAGGQKRLPALPRAGKTGPL